MYASSTFNEKQDSLAQTKQIDRLTSNQVCVASTMASLGMTADLDEVAFLLESGQAGKLSLGNSVGQHLPSGAISAQVCPSEANKNPKHLNQNVSDGNYIKRATYSLEKVSQSLDEIMASGKALLEGLALVNSKKLDLKYIERYPTSSEQVETRNTEIRRGTYDLEKVADSIDEAVDRGIPLEDSLNEACENLGNDSPENIGRSRIKRGTYDLRNVSVKVDASQHSGSSLEELLQQLGNQEDLLGDGISPITKPKRGTYDLDDISGQLDDRVTSGKSLKESLNELSLLDSEQVNLSPQDKRRTYDLTDVFSRLEQGINTVSQLEDLIDQTMASDNEYDNHESAKRRTYNLSDISGEVDRSVNSGKSLEESLDIISSPSLGQLDTSGMKRRTYDLTETMLNLQPSQDDQLDQFICNNNAIKCNVSGEQGVGEEVPNSSTCDSEESISAISSHEISPGKRYTYTLDNVASVIDEGMSESVDIKEAYLAFAKNQSPETGTHCTEDQKPVESILVELELSSEDGKHKVGELTPDKWIEQMKGLKKPPQVLHEEKIDRTSERTGYHKEVHSAGSGVKQNKPARAAVRSKTEKPKYVSKEKADVGSMSSLALWSNSERSLSISSSESSKLPSKSKLLSLSVSSSELSSRSTSEIKSRSLSESRSTSELKSSSSPDFSSNSNTSLEGSAFKNAKEISPGVWNYLTNKLGLSEEQCQEVHRRLSSSSDTSFETSSLECRKTYSLDDVAHSLDIATSQGLPMTKVLDNLDSDRKTPNDERIGGCEKRKKSDEESEQLNSDLIEEDQEKSSVMDKAISNASKVDHGSSSLRTVTLRSNFVQSKFSLNRRTYTLSKEDDSVDGNMSRKDPATPIENLCQFKLSTKKAVYKPSTKLHSFGHLLSQKNVPTRQRSATAGNSELKRNTYTLESVAETLEKAQDAGVPMIDALKRLSGSCKNDEGSMSENRKTYSLEDVSNTLESAAASGVPMVETLQKIADADGTENGKIGDGETSQSSKKKAPPKPKRTFRKPEIKFVSDSFVIEYFTSPKKSQSTSSEEAGDVKEDYVNQSSVDAAYGKVVLDNAAQAGSSESKSSSMDNLPTIDKEAKPTAKVVNDLDSLLVQLAAEVDKSQEVDSSDVEKENSGLVVACSSSVTKESNSIENVVRTEYKPEINAGLDSSCFSAKQESCSVTHNEQVLAGETSQAAIEKSTDISASTEKLKNDTVGTSGKKNIKCSGEMVDMFMDDKVGKTNLFIPVGDKSAHNCDSKNEDEGYCTLSRKPENSHMFVCDSVLRGGSDITVYTMSSDGMVAVDSMENTESITCCDVSHIPGQEGDMKLGGVEDNIQLSGSEEPGDLVDKSGGVSRELNLLRLKLAEKQRDIEAQKRRTKEQLEEERRRFGQNVFWFAVGKERQKKEANEIKPPNKTRDIKRVEQPLPSNSRTTLTSSHAEPCQKNKYITFTKQSSLDEDLPPSMGKLQDRTYNLKAVDENLRGSKDDLVPHTESPMVLPNQASPRLQPSEEIVHEFRLSRQTSGSQQPLLEKVQSPSKSGFPGNSNGFQVDSEKQRAPVMNYKSRISVPLTYPTKTVSENSSDVDNLAILSTSLDAPGLVDRPSNQASSPPRKCWDTDALNQDEPQFAVSKSNYHIFEQSRVIEGSGDNYESRQSNSRNDVDDQWTTREMYSKNMNAVVGEDNPDGPKSLTRFNDGRQTSSEVHVFDNKGSPEECQAIFEANGNSPANSGNSPSSENGDEGPKKGLALFIGEQNSAGENGLTPEQLKKRERFLKNRQQKMEEEKIKKEAILEKKKRKEEKMKEIELRRQKEERERQARLQQKKEQAELAKQERQKYEMRRKENLPRSNIVDGIPSGYSGFARTDVNPPTLRPAAEELSGFGVNGPVSTPSPSAFAGFTGVQSYVKPSGKTNRKLIINAISYVCLPGAVNKDTKEKCLQAMTESSAQHFLILFREGLKFRGLYSFDLENNQVLKVYGVGPRSVTEKMIERLYKYNSGGKEFSEIPAKGFSLSVDGFTLQKSCWQSSKPSVPSKTVSNYKSSTFRPTR